MGAASDNDYCPNCGSLTCSASCYYAQPDDEGSETGDGLWFLLPWQLKVLVAIVVLPFLIPLVIGMAIMMVFVILISLGLWIIIALPIAVLYGLGNLVVHLAEYLKSDSPANSEELAEPHEP